MAIYISVKRFSKASTRFRVRRFPTRPLFSFSSPSPCSLLLHPLSTRSPFFPFFSFAIFLVAPTRSRFIVDFSPSRETSSSRDRPRRIGGSQGGLPCPRLKNQLCLDVGEQIDRERGSLSLSLFLQPSNPNECIYRSDNRKKKREVVPRKGCLSKDKRRKESVGN